MSRKKWGKGEAKGRKRHQENECKGLLIRSGTPSNSTEVAKESLTSQKLLKMIDKFWDTVNKK